MERGEDTTTYDFEHCGHGQWGHDNAGLTRFDLEVGTTSSCRTNLRWYTITWRDQ